MNVKTLLETLDFNDVGHLDLNSVHPRRLTELILDGYIDEIDPLDGESKFYVLTSDAKEAMNG